ncbi:Uma2 family endonuclease [Leptothoe sp. ISB3NOV94-8A]
MVAASIKLAELHITWNPLPEDFNLDEKPLESTSQPLLAGALREPLELSSWIQPEMLIASNFGLCATMNDNLVIKAPDWLYVARVNQPGQTRKAYTPNLDGEAPAVVMEFLSDEDGKEYSSKQTFPPGKWFFYEQILKVPTYVIFEPEGGLLEVYHLTNGRYELEQPNPEGQYWLEAMGFFLGTWRGKKEERDGYWLRWWDANGQLLPWAVEKVAAVTQEADQERQRAEQEHQRAERLAEMLRSQGIDPDIV